MYKPTPTTRLGAKIKRTGRSSFTGPKLWSLHWPDGRMIAASLSAQKIYGYKRSLKRRLGFDTVVTWRRLLE